jgi:hypothetical protein
MIRPLTLLASCGALCALVAACADAPTAPRSYVQEADGAVWVAIVEPAGMPDVRTWLPCVPAGSEALARVNALRDEAARERRAGRLERALEMEGEASLLAAGSIAWSPPAPVVLGMLDALESWSRRAAERTETGLFPELQAAAARVSTHRDAARALLARGDTNAAAVELERSAQAAREYAPSAVGLRLIARLEERIARETLPTPNLKRAKMLLGTSREALASGDPARAVRRALYALQLVEGESRRAPSSGRRPTPRDSAGN